MSSTSTSFHTDHMTRAFAPKLTTAIKFGRADYLWDLVIYLPDGVDAQPIVDAFNAAMETIHPKQGAA